MKKIIGDPDKVNQELISLIKKVSKCKFNVTRNK